MNLDVLVVGAGFAGAVIAERMASAGREVLVIDKRDHIGGNAFDEYDSHSVLIHRYGPHIFHTNAAHVADYLSRFTDWQPYEHRVLSSLNGILYPIPINQTTINRLYGLSLDEIGVRSFLDRVREVREPVQTSEDVVLSAVGRDLCDKFFRNYTRKQWGRDLSQLSPAIAARIPTRTNTDDRYFTDKFQNMPKHGFSVLIGRMLEHKIIRVQLSTTYQDIRLQHRASVIFYTGPLDEYFGFCYGRLPYRSLRFEHEHHAAIERFQLVGTVNYPNDFQFTRVTEFKHLTGQKCPGTSIVREFPAQCGDPYYPVLTPQSDEAVRRYRDLARSETNTCFIGRLAEFRYYNMDQVVAAALKAAWNFYD